MKSYILKNAILGSCFVAAVMIYMTVYMKSNPDNEPNAYIGIASMIIAYAFIIYGMLQHRKENKGLISYKCAFLTGFKILVIISVAYVALWLIIYYNFFPNFMEQYSQMVLRNTQSEDLVEKTAEMNQMIEWYKNPLYIILLTLMEIFPIGLLTTVIAALFVKKNYVIQ